MTPTSDAPLLNTAKIKQLVEVLGPKKAAVLQSKFVGELSARLAELRARRDNVAEIGSTAHKLIGLAGAMGLDTLAACSQNLLHLAQRDHSQTQLDDALERVNRVGVASQHALQSALGPRP